MAKKQAINKKMNFMEIMEKNPDVVEILFNKGMHCIGCGLAGSETLEQGALAHGIDPDKLVKEINRALLKKDLGEKRRRALLKKDLGEKRRLKLTKKKKTKTREKKKKKK